MMRTLLTPLVAVLLLGAMPALAVEPAPLPPPEQQAMDDTLQHALENNPTNQASDWVNPDADHAGTVVPTRTFTGQAGQPCREFVTTVTIGGKEQQAYGTACRQPDGNWQVVGDEPTGAAPPPPPPNQALSTPPERYYAYPSGFYGPTSIYLSFGVVYRYGHVYRGRAYLDGPLFWARYPRVFVYRHHVHRWYDERYRRYPARNWRYDRYERHDMRMEHRREERREDRYEDRRGRRY